MTPTSTDHEIHFIRSVKGQIFVLFLALSIVPLIISGTIIFFQSQRIIRTEIEKGFTSMGDLQSMEITNWLAERKKDTLTLAGIARIQTMDAKTACPAVEQYFEQWAIYQDISLIQTDGTRLCDAAGNMMSVADSAFFKTAVAGDFVVSDPFIDEISDTPVIVAATPLLKDNEIIGVIALSVPTDYLSKLLATKETGDTREAYLVGKSGFFLSETRYTDDKVGSGRIKDKAQSELELKLNTTGVQKGLAGESGMGEYQQSDGQTVLGVYRPIPGLGSGAALLLEQDLNDVQKQSNQLRNSILLVGLFSATIVIVLAFVFGRSLTDPLFFISRRLNSLAAGDLERETSNRESEKLNQRRDEYGLMNRALENVTGYMVVVSDTAGQIARGDLTATVTARSEKDVIGISLQQMIAGLRELIGGVKENADQLEASSKHLEENSVQAGKATGQISTTIQQVAQGINQQAESVSKTANSANQMNRVIHTVATGAQEQEKAVARASTITTQITESIQHVASNAQTSAKGALETGEIARSGAQTVEETVKSMQSIKAKVGQSAEKVQEMGKRSNEIGAIVETIDEIASQTNLLALNAAIEAARAGAQGKGFAVVADEVRKLAERSSSATREIGTLIHGIQQTVAEAVTAMNAGAMEVENGVLRANQSGEALYNILSAVEVVNRQVNQIASAAQDINQASSELVVAMNTVSVVVQENINATSAMLESSNVVAQAIEAFASVSEENSAAVEEVSASTEEMNAQVEDMGGSAGSLSVMAQTLQSAVSKFRLN
jgi:methyl-accepting chemotaxis protein